MLAIAFQIPMPKKKKKTKQNKRLLLVSVCMLGTGERGRPGLSILHLVSDLVSGTTVPFRFTESFRVPDCISGFYPGIEDNSLVSSGLYLRQQDLYPGLRLYLSGPLNRMGEKLDEMGPK